MGGVVRGGVLRALVAEAHRIDAGKEVLSPAQKHGGDHEVDLVDQPGGDMSETPFGARRWMRRAGLSIYGEQLLVVVALSTTSEGSYGTNSAGAAIPVGRIGNIGTLRHRPPPSWSR